jgi:hypothetical protein
MRRIAALSAAVLLVAACSSSTSTGNSAGTSPRASGSGAPAPSTSTAPSGSAAAAGTFTLVSRSLAKEGAQVVLDASAADTTVVGSVLSQTTADDYDAGLVFSTDNGATWAWGGIVSDPGRTFAEAIASTPSGAIMVGTNEVTTQTGVTSKAFIAAAAAPDYVLKQVTPSAEFDGPNVHLQDIATISGVWIVVGWGQDAPDASGNTPRTSYMWRTTDTGATWTRQRIDIPGSTDNSIEQIVFGPDGSWNLIGQAVFDDGANQYDPIWLKSIDGGATFKLTNQDVLTAPFDQGATRIAFAGDGSAAILGWDEVSDGGSRVSALWASGADQKLTEIGTTSVPVNGGTPPGEFINGILWDGTQLAAWGTPTGAYPMDNVQFWAVTSTGLLQSSLLPGNGTPIAVSKMLVGTTSALAFGFAGQDLASADVAIWRGTLPG